MKNVLSIIFGIVIVFAFGLFLNNLGPDVETINEQTYKEVYQQVVDERGAEDFELKSHVTIDGLVDCYQVVVNGEVVEFVQLRNQ